MKTKKRKKKRALLYARVACLDQEQKPDRLMHQIDELIIYCQDHNIEVEGKYYEIASGASFDRREFKYLLNDIKIKNVKADLLLFTRWDRLSRNFDETAKMIRKLEKKGIQAKAITESENSMTHSIIKLFKQFDNEKSNFIYSHL